MKNKILSSVLTAALVFGLGTTGYYVFAHGSEADDIVNNIPDVQENKQTTVDYQELMQEQGINVDEMEKYMEQYGVDYNQMEQCMEQRGIDNDEMYQLMESGNFNFGEMLPYMQQIHPEISTEDARDMYERMHGTTGASNSKNFRSNMGSGMGGGR